MQKDSKFFEDMAHMATGAAGTLFDMKHEIEDMVASKMEKFMSKTSIVSREEFDAVKQMAEKARAENETLKKELEEIKARL